MGLRSHRVFFLGEGCVFFLGEGEVVFGEAEDDSCVMY